MYICGDSYGQTSGKSPAVKKSKKVLALSKYIDYNSTCCDIDSVEAEVAA